MKKTNKIFLTMNEHFKYVYDMYVKCLYKMHVRCYTVKCEMCNEKLGNNRYAGVPKITFSSLILYNEMYLLKCIFYHQN